MASVEIRSVIKAFGGHRAVDQIDLTVADGEFLVLLGPSGCGKTTLLRMVAGLEMPTRGDIVIGGRVVTRLAPRDRNVAMVFQNYALYPHLSVYENIAFPLRSRGQKEPKVGEKVRWAASLIGIERLLERKPRQTSGGERQRTALARSLVRDPSVFLLDEPLSNLDAKLRHSAREEIKSFQRRVGGTTIYVTHDQVEAMGLGDRIVVMEKGRVRQIGSPEQIYDAPQDTFVATFIGSPPMNLVTRESDIYGFRPETFLPRASFGPGADLVEIPLRVQRVEYLGGDRLVYGLLESPFPEAKVIARIPSTMQVSLREGERHDFAIRRADERRFAKDGGRRLAAA